MRSSTSESSSTTAAGPAVQVTTDFSKGMASKSSDQAPDWRLISKGLNARGYCKTSKCKVWQDSFYTPLGFGVFDLAEIVENHIRCPICHKLSVEIKKAKWTLYGCEWRSTPDGKWQTQEPKDGFIEYLADVTLPKMDDKTEVVVPPIAFLETRAIISIRPPGGISFPHATTTTEAAAAGSNPPIIGASSSSSMGLVAPLLALALTTKK